MHVGPTGDYIFSVESLDTSPEAVTLWYSFKQLSTISFNTHLASSSFVTCHCCLPPISRCLPSTACFCCNICRPLSSLPALVASSAAPLSDLAVSSAVCCLLSVQCHHRYCHFRNSLLTPTTLVLLSATQFPLLSCCPPTTAIVAMTFSLLRPLSLHHPSPALIATASATSLPLLLLP